MEKLNDPIAKCFICDEKLDNEFSIKFFEEKTRNGTATYQVLEQLLGLILDTKDESCVICNECFQKVNIYDEACKTAERVQFELTELLQTTEEKYNTGVTTAYVLENVSEEIEEAPSAPTELETLEMELVDDEVEFKTETNSDYGDDLEQYTAFEVLEEIIEDSVEDPQEMQDEAETEIMIPNDNLLAFDCDLCEKSFETTNDLRLHKRSFHSNSKFMCDICGQNYGTKAGLKMHMKSHATNNDELTPNRGNKHQCPHCEKSFTQKGGLKRHLPMHTGQKPFQCEQCGKQFIHYSSFYMHKMAHDGIREKLCKICGMKLSSNSHLNRHMLIHTGAKPYPCPKCGVSFAQRYNMMAHFARHNGITRKNKYKCDFCEQVFIKKSILDQHKSEGTCGIVVEERIDDNL